MTDLFLAEMSSYPSQGQGGYGQPDPNAILNQCRDVDRGIDSVENYIEQMNTMYRRIIGDADPTQENALRAQADDLANQTKNLYRNLIDRMKSIKKMPDAGSPRNSPQIGRVERRLKTAIGSYQKVQTDFRKGLEQQMQRQYRIVRPDATDAEVQEAVQDSSNQQIFSQAVRPHFSSVCSLYPRDLYLANPLRIAYPKRPTRRCPEGFPSRAGPTRGDPEDRA